MSASTVSITAANPGARRRPVIAIEKKTATNLELLANDVAVSPAVATSGDGATGRDLSHHSVRGEALLDRTPRDLAPAKKVAGGNSSSVPPRRARKLAAKAEKPRWLTLVSIFGKNMVLLVVLAGLVQLIWRMSLKSGDGMAGGYVGFSEFEGRISDVEGLLKKTARMIQVQVDVVDKKIEDEVRGLRRELNEKIEEKGEILENGLKKMEAKNEELERYLSELKGEDWLSKEEFEKFVDEVRSVKGSGYEGGGLDEIREFARRVIVKEIEKHAADGLGRVDYALASSGGAVVKHSEVFDLVRGNWFLKSARNGVHPNAEKMLKPSFGEPGQCFPLKDSRGFVQIRLRTAIIPEAVTLEHVAKSVAYDRSSAPKDCRVSGWLQEHNADSAINTEKMHLLAEFTYDLEKSNAQTFNVLNSAASGVINTVRLDFTSNHGSPSHTCIYRFRVHGHEPDSVSMLALEL
ncbi:SUN domain-containing protein 1-like [Glycine soja]|uniref:SUN domain-containing protein 1 isoform A n=1 Tax=Glycine soja TaxID=3848 RepID=A0A445GWZ9_GLYSO|nr:SUN domain-containing protein 1-like [Glycine soja]XP_028204612.1 SUN domain-containing protein 1-like [Glycine soja]XP_028204613.1 SUN domain-containing protein 1-like [Glycine soja]RZB65785.1 SUN domain-containing protein 1 isoform A [Glycine soja]RZB65786.1 SUN domain-containing protein 1 isoform B [Glycine soja]RZB65787.1 SUN domain-containing protein 1 isoform C [Glycine soja]